MNRKIFSLTIVIVLVAVAVMVVATPHNNAAAAPAASTLSMLGADVSSVQRSLDLGQKYYNASGTQQDPLTILKGVGVNYVRLRIWNSPASGYNNKTKVLAYAKTVKAAGLSLSVRRFGSDWANQHGSRSQTTPGSPNPRQNCSTFLVPQECAFARMRVQGANRNSRNVAMQITQ